MRNSRLIVCRIILDASTRRFQAHKIYLKAAAGMRWVMLRRQLAQGNHSPGTKAQGYAQIDTRLSQVCHLYPLHMIDTISMMVKIGQSISTWDVDRGLHHAYWQRLSMHADTYLTRSSKTSLMNTLSMTCELLTVERTTGLPKTHPSTECSHGFADHRVSCFAG